MSSPEIKPIHNLRGWQRAEASCVERRVAGLSQQHSDLPDPPSSGGFPLTTAAAASPASTTLALTHAHNSPRPPHSSTWAGTVSKGMRKAGNQANRDIWPMRRCCFTQQASNQTPWRSPHHPMQRRPSLVPSLQPQQEMPLTGRWAFFSRPRASSLRS